MLKYLNKILTNSRTIVIHIRSCTTAINETAVDQTIITSQPSFESRLLKVAVLGMPNAGKSTFINNLMDRKVCPTSSKVHTTRGKTQAIFTEGDAQIIFVDTPGLVNDREHRKFNLEKTFMKDSRNVAKEADIIGVIHDVSNFYTRERLDIKIINLLELNKSKPSFLVFNKVDMLKTKRKLLDLTRQVTNNSLNGQPIVGSKPKKKSDGEHKGWPYFQEIFMVSSLTGDGLDHIRDFLVRNAKPGEWIFPQEVWTDQSAETIIIKSVHAKLLDFIPQEIPYRLKPEIEYLNIDENGVITTVVLVRCPSERIAKLIAGASDGKIRQITASVEKDLQETFLNIVKITIVLEFVPVFLGVKLKLYI